MKTAKNVLSLSSDDAISFFLKSQQYHNLELPEYFVKFLNETSTFCARFAGVSTENTKVQKNKKRSFCIFVKISNKNLK